MYSEHIEHFQREKRDRNSLVVVGGVVEQLLLSYCNNYEFPAAHTVYKVLELLYPMLYQKMREIFISTLILQFLLFYTHNLLVINLEL